MLKQTAFSLLELLIVLAIIGILTTITYPLYTSHLTKIRRDVATATLIDIAARTEEYYTYHNSYSGITLDKLQPTKIDFYNFTLKSTKDNYIISADPYGSQATNDLVCGVLTLDQNGGKTISGTGTLEECWH